MRTRFHIHAFTASLFWLVLLPAVALAHSINVEQARNYTRDKMQLIDASIKLDFSGNVIKALEYGVPLVIKIKIQLRRERNWMWDELIKEQNLRYQLRHHPLSNDYLITDLDTGRRMRRQTLEQALHRLGTLKAYPFIETAALAADQTYIGLIKAEFNIESLPAPLQPGAYVSSQLRLESPWYEWNFRE